MLSHCDISFTIELCRWDGDLMHLLLEPAIVDWKPVVAAILSALSFLHDKHLVHRDVKPENVLIKGCPASAALSFALCDFARTTDVSPNGLLVGQRYLGTRPYASPECLCGVLCAGADVWACGCILFAIIERGLPYEDEDVCSATPLPVCTTLPWLVSTTALLDGLLRWDHRQRLSAASGALLVAALGAEP
jgi:serine/threonine protein kinase